MAVDVSRLIKTSDPYVYAEELSPGYARYVDVKDGRRWEVKGTCMKIGKCWEGSADPDARLRNEAGGIDCPVGPGFSDCCPLEVTMLDPAEV